MQPEPSTTPRNASLNNTTTEPDESIQYGHSPDLASDHLLSDSYAVGTESVEIDAPNASPGSSDTSQPHAQGGSSPQSLRGLNTDRATPSPPPGGSRITEYENSSTPPVKRRYGLEFEVVKRERSPSDKKSPIQDLPNEILTHALAHLSPIDLTSVALVSHRFHQLVTGPHAWRSAFAHYFPGPESLNSRASDENEEENAPSVVRSDRRPFTRLTALASWRSEYIIRTRLLRSLSRGKPSQAITSSTPNRTGSVQMATPIIMYNSQLFTTINHLHATFGPSGSKQTPRFIHGADDVGTATSSDPNAAKVDPWGLSDPQFFLQFAERFPGDAQYGLGPGELVGVPNVMDVSQPYGLLYGEGFPNGRTYFRSTKEMRGRFLSASSDVSSHDVGMPSITPTSESITSVWIAKSDAIPSLTEGLVGMLSGSSAGVVNAYSLGSTLGGNKQEQRHERGELTARWVLSPGVPIISIAVDNEYSMSRQAQNRIWAVVLNALGEIFYLTKFPNRSGLQRSNPMTDERLERMAWMAGRTVYWNIVESSRRQARPDPYADAPVDGSYSPRSSWNGMCLDQKQIEAETIEMERFISRKPKDFRKACLSWDMRRRLMVDFANDDGNHAGESVVVMSCGHDDDTPAHVQRFMRCRISEKTLHDAISTPPLSRGSTGMSTPPSLFGSHGSPALSPTLPSTSDRLADSLSREDILGTMTPRALSEEWRRTTFSLDGLKHVEILATAMDESIFAVQTISEDPLMRFSTQSAAGSPHQTSMSPTENISDPSDVPGQRARLLAIGTQSGIVVVWNLRAPTSRASELTNIIEPVRVIYTDSPQISCLALSSLYLVHGGNDGLVQAWDPLGSSLQPIRTLNSRFSSRARRRLIQAQASAEGVGINLFAAGSICLDPDPTLLRGMASLGTHLRFWSYSSSAADQYKSHKRRLRRSERGSNNGGERFVGVTRSNLNDYIASERYELDREKADRRKQAARIAGRFGTEMLEGNEEELLAYAAMLSQETLEEESRRRASDTSTTTSVAFSSSNDPSNAPSGHDSPSIMSSPRHEIPKTEEELDADIAEAIRQSLAPSSPPTYDIPIRHVKLKGRKGNSARSSPRTSPTLSGSSSREHEMSDLDFALQLSLAESMCEPRDEFPSLVGRSGIGKGKSRMG